jgi:hypothetical protein
MESITYIRIKSRFSGEMAVFGAYCDANAMRCDVTKVTPLGRAGCLDPRQPAAARASAGSARDTPAARPARLIEIQSRPPNVCAVYVSIRYKLAKTKDAF